MKILSKYPNAKKKWGHLHLVFKHSGHCLYSINLLRYYLLSDSVNMIGSPHMIEGLHQFFSLLWIILQHIEHGHVGLCSLQIFYGTIFFGRPRRVFQYYRYISLLIILLSSIGWSDWYWIITHPQIERIWL